MSNPFNSILSNTTDRRSSLSALPPTCKDVVGSLEGDENNPKTGNDNGIKKTTSNENLHKFNQMIANNSNHGRATPGKRSSKRASVAGLVNTSKAATKSSKSSSSSTMAPSSKKQVDSKVVMEAAVAINPSAKKTIKQVDEVHILISRLKTLVGDVDEKAILDNYHKKNAASQGENVAGDEGATILSPKKAENAGASTIITFRSPEKNATESSVEYDITYSLVIDESSDDGTSNPLKNSSIRVSEAIPRRRLPTRYSLGSKRFSLDNTLPGCSSSHGAKYRSFSGDSDMSESSSVSKNFTHFYCAGASRGVLSGTILPEKHCALQAAALLDSYPSNVDALMENVQDYCFPEGVVARLVLKCNAAKYVGASNDQFHLMQFSDATGKATYGCCLIITEAISVANATVFENLVEKENMNSAADKIYKALVAYASRRRCEKRKTTHAVAPSKSPFNHATGAPKTPGGSVMSRLKQTLDLSIAKSQSKFLTFASDLIATPSADAAKKQKLLNAEDQVVQQYLRLIQSGNEGCGDSDLSDDDEGEEREDAYIGGANITPSAKQNEPPDSAPQFSDAPLIVAENPREKRRLKMDECLVLTERAFCLVSERPLPSFLFKVLQAVANKERLCGDELLDCSSSASEGAVTAVRIRSESAAAAMSDNICSSDGLACDIIYESRRVRRHNFLEYMSTFKSAKTQDASFPSYTPPFRVENRATTLEESSVAAVFCTLPVDAVVKILSLLLTEKSLVVHGSHGGTVSTVATGLLSLLKPFTWEGVFVPLMPRAARNVLQAPVPFVIGTLRAPTLSSLSDSVAVLYLDDYLDTNSSGMHSPSSSSNTKRYLYNPADSDPEYFYDPAKNLDYREMKSRLSRLAQQLKLSSSSQSSLSKRSASLQLTSLLTGMQAAEKSIVRDLLAVTYAHNKGLCGDLFTPFGWRNYGAVRSSTGDFEFYPQWFMDPLHMQLKFQEKVIHTQMFVSFMDKKRIDYTNLRARSRLFLSEWIFFRSRRAERASRS